MEAVKQFYEALGNDTQMQERAKELTLGQSQDKEASMAALINFAAKEGYSFTAEEAEAYFENRHKGEVADEELDGVVGAGAIPSHADCIYVGWDLNTYVHDPFVRSLIDNCRFDCPYCLRNAKKYLQLYDE